MRLPLLFALLLAAQGQNVVVLPRPTTSGGRPLLDALKARASGREYAPRKLAPATLSNLLWAAYGVNRPDGKRTAPSAYNWQVIEVYVALPEGLYRYEAPKHRLELVAAVDAREISGTQDFVATAPLNLVFVAKMGRMKASAEDTETDLLVWAAVEAGAISQNVSLFCAAEGLATVVRAGVQREAFTKAAKLPGDARILLAQTVGYPK
jgi:nitroreductase